MVTVVGVGPGARDYMVPAAIRRIEQADLLVGGKRHLNLFQDLKCEKIPLEKGLNFEDVFSRKGCVVILASGDPGLYGILDLVLKYANREEVEVIPGISSAQYIMAKLALPMKDSAVVSLHGRMADMASLVNEYRTLVVLTDENHDPRFIARLLKENGIKDRILYVGENLSYDNEEIEKYTVEELARSQKKFDINVVVITCGNMPSASRTAFL
ncbi:MAG: precorrin-6y C5,15-methyltransferase (decarboxylating) subunit CbiE [Tepidanaerobacteraceae bacterium]|jgi:cobalt-precorrin-7 (C5)-methyltransferase|nr:precorrin-6y C5,15-methyltransferase (decarboxylating) subunit CbiE [Tepidanaerobacteraceae bacterium]